VKCCGRLKCSDAFGKNSTEARATTIAHFSSMPRQDSKFTNLKEQILAEGKDSTAKNDDKAKVTTSEGTSNTTSNTFNIMIQLYKNHIKSLSNASAGSIEDFFISIHFSDDQKQYSGSTTKIPRTGNTKTTIPASINANLLRKRKTVITQM
jgi:hypothetical protein